MTIKKIQQNLSKNMLFYASLSMIIGVVVGYHFNLKWLTSYIKPIVFMMIFPMMVNLSLSSLKKIKGSVKPLIEAMILNFVISPFLMWLLTSLFVSDPKIRLALMLLSIAPASSMGLGYIGLAEGHMLTGAIIVAFAFLLSVFVYPVAGHYFAVGANIPVPLTIILKNLFIILILPLFFGILVREYIERRHGPEGFLKAKPYFSTITLTFLYILLFVIFASKANLILKKYTDIILLFPLAILFYGITTLIIFLVNRKILALEYGHHQAVVFTTVSKNVALTIAILISVFGKEGQYISVFPAIMSIYQTLFLVTYLKLSNRVKNSFESENKKEVKR